MIASMSENPPTIVRVANSSAEQRNSITSNDATKARKIMGNAKVRDVLINSDGMQDFLVCSMKMGGIQAGSIFLFDLSRVFDRTQMKDRFEAFQQTLDQLSTLRLASLEAPQAATHTEPEDLFDRWKMATTSRLSAGLRSSKVCPLCDSTHSPSMKFLKTRVLVVLLPNIAGPVMVSVAMKPPGGTVQIFYANNREEGEQGRGACEIQLRRRGAGARPFRVSVGRSLCASAGLGRQVGSEIFPENVFRTTPGADK